MSFDIAAERRLRRFAVAGFPHSEIPGSKVGSHLPEAYRRHPTSFIASISQGILHLPIKIITLTTHLLTTKIKPKGGFWLISPYSIFKVPDNQSYKRKNRFREAIFFLSNTTKHPCQQRPLPFFLKISVSSFILPASVF